MHAVTCSKMKEFVKYSRHRNILDKCLCLCLCLCSMFTFSVCAYDFVCAAKMWQCCRLASHQFTLTLSILHIEMTHITGYSLSSIWVLVSHLFLIHFFSLFQQTKCNIVRLSSAQRAPQSFGIFWIRKKGDHLQCKCIYANRSTTISSMNIQSLCLTHSAQFPWYMFLGCCFFRFVSLRFVWFVSNILSQQFHSFDWNIKIYSKVFTFYALLSCCHYLTCKNISHKVHHTAPSIDSVCGFYCFALRCLVFW